MHAHPGNISKRYSTLLEYFITHHKADTLTSLLGKKVLQAKFQILLVGEKELLQSRNGWGNIPSSTTNL